MHLVTLTRPTSTAAEAYRTLRTNLFFAALDAPLKTLLVAGLDDGDDAVIALANLAVTLAQSERRVIAMDANLRRPSLHTQFEVPNDGGLSDMLAGGLSDGMRAPHLTPTAVSGLSVLTGGVASSNAADLLSSNRMDEALLKISGLCDVTLVCAPPLIEFSDAAILASKVDGTLLAVRSGKTRRDSAQKAKDILLRAHARMLGAVLLDA